MAEQTKPGWTLLTAIVSALSGFGIAYLSFSSKVAETTVQREQIAVEQTKFDAEQKSRHDEILKQLIPKLLGVNEQEKKVALATLFVLLPNQASNILTIIQSSFTEQQKDETKKAFEPAIKQAQNLADETDQWIIVSGGDNKLDQAQGESSRAVKNGYSSTIYLKENSYRTTIGPFPTQTDAQRANISVRATLRSDAYVVNLKTWCPQNTAQNGYLDCNTKAIQ